MRSKVLQPGGLSPSPALCPSSPVGGINFGSSDTFSIALMSVCICMETVGCPYIISTFTTTLILTQTSAGHFRYRTTDGSGNVDTTVDWTQNLDGDWIWSISINLKHQPGYDAGNPPTGSPCDDCGCTNGCSWMYWSGGNTLGPHGEFIPTCFDKSSDPYGDKICDNLAPLSECCLGIEINGTLNTCADQTLPASAGFYGYNYAYTVSP